MRTSTMTSALLLLTAVLASSSQQGGPHYRDNNENGALAKDGWDTWNGLYRSFIRASFGIPESSPKILQGLRDKDGNALITRYNLFNWSQFRQLPTEAGVTPQDNAEWLNEKLTAAEHAVETYGQRAQECFVESGGDSSPRGQRESSHGEQYQQLKERAEAAIPLLKRVHNYYQRKAWVEGLFAYTEASYQRQHTQLQYSDPWGTIHNYKVKEDATNASEVVFERAAKEDSDQVPEQLVLSEQFANKPVIHGRSADGTPHGMNLVYSIEHGWRVKFLEGYEGLWCLWNNKNCTVKFLNFQDGINNTTRGY